jgi:hypothetical protein
MGLMGLIVLMGLMITSIISFHDRFEISAGEIGVALLENERCIH